MRCNRKEMNRVMEARSAESAVEEIILKKASLFCVFKRNFFSTDSYCFPRSPDSVLDTGSVCLPQNKKSCYNKVFFRLLLFCLFYSSLLSGSYSILIPFFLLLYLSTLSRFLECLSRKELRLCLS